MLHAPPSFFFFFFFSPLLSQGWGARGGRHVPTFRAPRRRQRPGGRGSASPPPGCSRCLGWRRHRAGLGAGGLGDNRAPSRGARSLRMCLLSPCRAAASRCSLSRCFARPRGAGCAAPCASLPARLGHGGSLPWHQRHRRLPRWVLSSPGVRPGSELSKVAEG